MNTRIPANTVPAALRQLLVMILLVLRAWVPLFRGPFACLVLASTWGALLVLTGLADALGRVAPWYVLFVLFLALVTITLIGSLVPRPDTFPHATAWKRAKVVFFAVCAVVLPTVYLAALFAFSSAASTPPPAA